MTQKLEGKDLIMTLNPNDILCGRGSGPHYYSGNIKFRNMVYERRAEYLASITHKAKRQIAHEIIDQFCTRYTPTGRFLKQLDSKTTKKLGINQGKKVWVEVDIKTALEKTKQALRQNRDYPSARNRAKKYALHRAESMSISRYPQSETIRTFSQNHCPIPHQENNCQDLQNQREIFNPPEYRQPSIRFPSCNIVGVDTLSWDNFTVGTQTQHRNYSGRKREQIWLGSMVPISTNISQSRFHPMEMKEFAEQAAKASAKDWKAVPMRQMEDYSDQVW